MQAIWQSKDEGSASRRADLMGAVLCAERGSRCVEEKHVGEAGSRGIRIQDSRRIFSRDKEGVWGRRERVSKGSRVEEAGAGKENNGGICLRIQEGSKRKWV